MSLFRRMSQVFQQKANAALNKVEDPGQALDLSYEKLLENLQQVRRSIADVLTSQKRLEAQRAQLQAQYDKLQGQARQALQQGQDDVAREALNRANTVEPQITALDPQIAQLSTQVKALEQTGAKLQSRIEVFRAQRDTMKAQYTAAKASTSAMESLTGLSEQMTDVNLMMDRAKDKVQQLQARSEAVSQLADSGVLDSPALGGSGDDIERALSAGSAANVDLQLQQLKAELAAPAASQKEVGAGSGEEPSTMVIRISGEGRYRVPLTIQAALEGLDTAMDTALKHEDADGFQKCAVQLSKLIKDSGTRLEDTDLTVSELVVPSPEMSIDDAKKLLSTDGEEVAEDTAG